MEKNRIRPVTTGKNFRMSYSRQKEVLEMPNLIEVQKDSYDWFLREGLREVFDDISPIADYSGHLSLDFVDFTLCTGEDDLKYTIEECKERDATFAAPLKVKVRLYNKETDEINEHEIFMGDLPLMTETGTFVINGAERVIVSQLVRSPGIYYAIDHDKLGKGLYSCTVIPNRGAWLEYETDSNDVFYVRVDRTRKVPVTVLVRALGYGTNPEIIDLFGEEPKILATLAKDTAESYQEGLLELYKKIRPGEPLAVDSAESLIMSMFFDPRRYDLAKVGRYKFNKKLMLRNRITGHVLAEDVVDTQTGEILAEAGTEVTRELADEIQNAAVPFVMIQTEERDVRVISSMMVDLRHYVDVDPEELGITELVYYPALKKILEENAIPVFVTSKTGYFAATEVQTVLNFLRVLNNPLQEIPLFGVLKSVLFGFSDAQLATLRALDETGKRCLYDCVKLAAGEGESGEGSVGYGSGSNGADASLREKCCSFLSFLNRYREYAVYLPIHKLMEQFLEETGYLYTVSALPGGVQRRINVEMLLTRAESFEKTSYSGLFHFIRYMEQLEKYDIDYGETGASDENADVVRIMSIHKSKGLEFPVCFVSGLSKRFNRQDSVAPVLMDMDLGLAIDWVDPTARIRHTTLKKNVLARKLNADSMGEELRVLYVALTRAEEKLILTGTCKEDKLPQEDAAQGAYGYSALRLQEASSYYDLVLPAWQSVGRRLQICTQEELLQAELVRASLGYNSRQKLFEEAGKEPEAAELALCERLQKPYAHENLAGLFVKTTVSELKKEGMQEEAAEGLELFPEEEVVPYLPQFVREQEETVSGTTRGSAYHRLLEIFPFERQETWTAEKIRTVIEEYKADRRLSEEYAAAINVYKIRAFLQTPLAARMAKAARSNRLHREQPFVLGLSANRLNTDFPEDETVLIQGIIDVYLEEEDGIVLADYKTDLVKDPKELILRYRVQLDYYEEALVRLTGKCVKEKLIYSFGLEQEITL